MLAVVRVKMMNGSDSLWNYVLENHSYLENKLNDCVQLMYVTKRERFEDTNLFIHAENPDCFGNFLAKVIAKIPDVDALWLFNLFNMRFFHTEENLINNLSRYVVTIKGYPNKFENIYNKITKLQPTKDSAPTYLAYTFHLFGDSILFSLLANDKKIAKNYIEKNIKPIPGVLSINISTIKKQQRIVTKEGWKLYVKSNLLPKE